MISSAVLYYSSSEFSAARQSFVNMLSIKLKCFELALVALETKGKEYVAGYESIMLYEDYMGIKTGPCYNLP